MKTLAIFLILGLLPTRRGEKKPVLTKTLFRMLINDLGLSYGLMGDLAKAKETLEYGVTQQPDCPLVYYNLACMCGELDKMDDALAQLRLAYKNKANMTPGDKFPDSLKDDSFRNFVKDKRFLDAVRAMQGE
jgi:predicted Zn-dependent protease